MKHVIVVAVFIFCFTFTIAIVLCTLIISFLPCFHFFGACFHTSGPGDNNDKLETLSIMNISGKKIYNYSVSIFERDGLMETQVNLERKRHHGLSSLSEETSADAMQVGFDINLG
ncbi:hypothetical protein ACJX0J_040001 [Zea mays]